MESKPLIDIKSSRFKKAIRARRKAFRRCANGSAASVVVKVRRRRLPTRTKGNHRGLEIGSFGFKRDGH